VDKQNKKHQMPQQKLANGSS